MARYFSTTCGNGFWQVPELKKKVAELGLPTKGTKAELLARVEKYLHEQGAC